LIILIILLVCFPLALQPWPTSMKLSVSPRLVWFTRDIFPKMFNLNSIKLYYEDIRRRDTVMIKLFSDMTPCSLIDRYKKFQRNLIMFPSSRWKLPHHHG
jgi:hypothetical protein